MLHFIYSLFYRSWSPKGDAKTGKFVWSRYNADTRTWEIKAMTEEEQDEALWWWSIR